jgi:hypothetical protein
MRPIVLPSGLAMIFRSWKELRYRLSECRIFFNLPLHISTGLGAASGLTVVLYGVPYGDWSNLLADAAFWRELGGVAEVWRVPAFAWLLPLLGRDCVVVPMKAPHCRKVPPGSRGLFPDAHAVAILDDKRKFQEHILRHGLDSCCPRTYRSAAEATFPCVVKRLDTSGSIGIRVADSPEHLRDILRQAIFLDQEHVLQELVPGNVEHASFFVCKEGRVLWHWTFASLMSGATVIKSEDNDKDRRIVDTPPVAIAWLEKILSPLKYDGPCIANYKIAPDGNPRFFEINPRFGGSLLQPRQKAELLQAMGCILGNATARA